MFVLIDNYDSFTWNLYHYLGELGADVAVHRNDAISVDEVLGLKPQGIILSPGPCDPDRAGICLPVVAAAATHRIPLLGVCLGHQAIGQALGGRVVRGPVPMHGKVSHITHRAIGLFDQVPTPLAVARYHSLVVERTSLPPDLRVTAETSDGVIMAMAHISLPIFGVQFHPESIASEHGHRLLANFLISAGINPREVQVVDTLARETLAQETAGALA